MAGRLSNLDYLLQVSPGIPAAVRLFSACTFFHHNRVLAAEASRLQYAIDGERRRGAAHCRIGSRSSARPSANSGSDSGTRAHGARSSTALPGGPTTTWTRCASDAGRLATIIQCLISTSKQLLRTYTD